MEKAEPQPIPRASEIVAGHDEVAVRVGLQNVVACSDSIEERPLRKCQVILALGLHDLPNDATEGQRVTVAVSKLRAGGNLQGLIDGVKLAFRFRSEERAGSQGTFLLTVPTAMLEAGKPATLKVYAPKGNQGGIWFGILEACIRKAGAR